MKPLAARCRPETLDDYIGQSHLTAPGKPLRVAYDRGELHSMIFWGPPGTGKTTLAKILASKANAELETLSAVSSGVKDVRAVVARAEDRAKAYNQSTVLFIDEIHRFNKSQQDAFLPHVEEGVLTLIGATTENPSFELNNALLSRAKVYVLKSLDEEALLQIIDHALQSEYPAIQCEPELRKRVVDFSDGDARRTLNLLELAVELAEDENITDAVLDNVLTGSFRQFDKGGEAFYDQISALHKSVRGSSPDGALYWLCRMLDGGCDPLYIARRVLRMASEDIGNADPRALTIALNALDTYERLGSPEGELAIAQAVMYLASCAKSNAVYTAFNQVMQVVKQSGSLDVPLHLRNAPTKLMKQLDYGKQYRYAHDEPEAYAAGEQYLPDALKNKRFYQPVPRGLEKKIADKLAHLRQLDDAVK
ncbi:MAG: recombination factor protein RarA [marine bacterium B5-7]|nr:MAG: recombination factor protein RarA [marine bacterium B5-7]